MLLLLVGCGNGTFPNINFCVDMTRDTGICTEALTGKQKNIPADKWPILVKKSVKVPLEEAQLLIIFAENYCRKKKNKCTAKASKTIESFRSKILKLNPKPNEDPWEDLP